MNAQETVDQMKQLKLKGMMQAYQALLDLPAHEQLSLHQAIARLTEAQRLAMSFTLKLNSRNIKGG